MIEPRKGDSLIVAHARRELELAGAFKKTEDYDGVVGRSILALVKTFDQWTKGDTALMQTVAHGFAGLIAGELLTPPTDDPEEWERVPREDNKRVWRNKRSPFIISTDHGRSWFNLSNQERGKSRNHITGEDPQDGEDQQPGAEDTTVPATEGAQAPSDSTGNGQDGENAGGDQHQAEQPAEDEGRSVNTGVASEGSEDPKPKKKGTKKSGKGTTE